MDIAAKIDRLRTLEADQFGDDADQCVIREPTGEQFTKATLEYASTPGAQIYAGPCRFKPDTDIEETGGEREVTFRRGILAVPHTVTGAAVNQEVILTSTTDGQLNGAVFRVTGVKTESWLVTRHLQVEMVTEETDQEVTDV